MPSLVATLLALVVELQATDAGQQATILELRAIPVSVAGRSCTPGNARASDRSPRRPVRVAPWPAGGPRDRVGHRVPGHWAGMAGAWAYPAGRTTEAGTSSPNAAPPGFRDPGRVHPNGRSPPGGPRWSLAVLRSSPEVQQPVPAGWRPRMASLNRTRKKYHPAPYPRERLPTLVP